MAIKSCPFPHPHFQLFLVLFVAWFVNAGCSRGSAEERRRRDESVGRHQGNSLVLEAEGGLTHFTAIQEDKHPAEIRLRASTQEFRLRITRRVESLTALNLEIANVPPNLRLRASLPALGQGVVDATGSPVPGRHLTSSWQLEFPPGEHTVEISAEPLPVAPFTFLAFGDIQNAIPEFGSMAAAMAAEENAEFVLVMGDLANRTLPEEYNAIDEHWKALKVPVYTTPGNHDVFVENVYQDRFGRANYSMRHRGVHFTSVDSASATVDAQVFSWIQKWMEEASANLHVVFSHIPPREYLGVRSGQWSSRKLANRFIAQALRGKVDLFLFGHIHTYEKYHLAGIPTYISGGGGAIPMKLDQSGRHFLRVHADAIKGELQVERVDVD